MSSREHQSGTEFPYLVEDVFRAVVLGADNLPGMHVDTQDAASGRIVVGVGLTPGTEFKLPITVEQVGPRRTRISLTQVHGRSDPERSAAAMEKILGATSETLKVFTAPEK